MHCVACDKTLSDYETTRKNESTGEYIDLCNRCFKEVREVAPSLKYSINPVNTRHCKEDKEDVQI